MKPTSKAIRIAKGGHLFEIADDGSAHLWDDSYEESVIDRSKPIRIWIESSEDHFREGAFIPVIGGYSCICPFWGALRIAALLGMEITLEPEGQHSSFKVVPCGIGKIEREHYSAMLRNVLSAV